MSRPLPIALAQAAPRPADEDVSGFTREVEELTARFPEARFVVFPELHLHGTRVPPRERDAELEASAEPLDGPRSKAFAQLAGDLGIWLVPGSVCERGPDGALHNTALAFSPEGRLAAWYRKIFPWRPYEPYRPGDRFVVFDVPGTGRVGFAICYDAWFPEVARHLAWMGAEVIVNPVMTTTADRAQELVLARANAIVNQVYVVSVNTAAPVGTGRSLVVDPEGRVRAEAGEVATVLTDVLDLDDVTRVRRYGTAGLNRVWAQFTEADEPLDLPLYQGRIDPARWYPAGG
ncbi:putative amidohydrolase [Streptosporangium becharense]|uniref:Putative amidohydrolase n=1 Tax=Streptosporangium becharense TaxID=1816182 RepID=A0A7W9MK51_9ACTN|nr:carbon-nitrogen hydrolase family protein [Streptosporangium becharense]MBB2910515.1 putative amidohydrolase [Streptosporangium becharense]MBB5823258.1 putative amidohydrolase [Streptosporangium becharense]